jgi:hypothetical protein
MSQQLRRVLLAAGLTVALLLALPAPSRATGLREPGISCGFMDRVWSWLESLLPAAPASQPARPQGPAGRKTLGTAPPPPPPTADQGSMIDPDGKH